MGVGHKLQKSENDLRTLNLTPNYIMCSFWCHLQEKFDHKKWRHPFNLRHCLGFTFFHLQHSKSAQKG